MTLPPSLSDLDPDSESERELTRLTLVVGDLMIDVGVPADVSISEYILDVVAIANEQQAGRNRAREQQFDATENKWTLSRIGGPPIDPQRSLDEFGIYDGDLVMICDTGRSAGSLLFDDIVNATETPSGGRLAVRNALNMSWFAVASIAAVAIAALVPRYADRTIVPASVLGAGVLGVVLACVVALRPVPAGRSAWLSAAALPLVFGGALYVVPGGYGATSLPMAFALTALSSLVVLLISGSGRVLHTFVISACAFGGAATTALLIWQPPVRSVGAIIATLAVIVVYLAPRVTIALSKLPLPRVPTAGEPLDDIETQGGTTVEGVNAVGKQIIPTEEGLIRRVTRANSHLTGLLAAATLTAAVGSYLAVDVSNGFFWQGTAFAVVVATVLCLRGRGHHDVVQSAVLIGGGLAIAIAVIVKTAVNVEDWQIRSVLGLLALTGLVVVCGLIAPRRVFSPVARRWVEILEYVAVGLMFPLCFWIIRLYAYFRELDL